jgi:DNA-binding transcriptional LysR family regulator
MIWIPFMQSVHLEGLDLNLLVALRALLVERHVTRAAARVRLSQPAMSHALARLRALLGDPLLVRTPKGMQPTPRAAAMREPLERALEDLGRLLAPQAFDPKTSAQRFRVSTSDYAELVLLPSLAARVWAEAPGVDLAVSVFAGGAVAALGDDRIDLVITPPLGGGEPAPGLHQQRLFDERFVCVVREDHPLARRRMSIDDFAALPHALITPRGQSARGAVDDALEAIGKRRRIALEIPHFLVAPHVVRETDVVLTLAARVARLMAPMLGLRVLPPPLEVPGFSMAMLWHERSHADPAHAWLRRRIAEVAKRL